MRPSGERSWICTADVETGWLYMDCSCPWLQNAPGSRVSEAMPVMLPPRGPELGVPPSGLSTRKSEYDAMKSNLSPSALITVHATSVDAGIDDQWKAS